MGDQEQLTASYVAETIKSGDFDGDLIPLLEAVRIRFQLGTTEQKWQVEYCGEVITQDSLTLAEAAIVERQCRTTWASVNPLVSAAECQAIMAVHIARNGTPFSEAMEAAGAIPFSTANAAASTYEVMRAPKVLAA